VHGSLEYILIKTQGDTCILIFFNENFPIPVRSLVGKFSKNYGTSGLDPLNFLLKLIHLRPIQVRTNFC